MHRASYKHWAATRLAETFFVSLSLILTAGSLQAQTPAPTPQTISSPATAVPPLALDEALRLANAQASTYQIAILNERIASEDVRQAQAAFKPKVSAPLEYIYTSPANGLPPGEPRTQSFIANNAISEYLAMATASGELDVAGKLRATLA